MTYNTINQYDIQQRTSQYTAYLPLRSSAQYTPSYVGAYDRKQRAVVMGTPGYRVRYTADAQLGGFWREANEHVDFFTFESPEGERIRAAFELLGIPLRNRLGLRR